MICLETYVLIMVTMESSWPLSLVKCIVYLTLGTCPKSAHILITGAGFHYTQLEVSPFQEVGIEGVPQYEEISPF